MKKGNQVKLKGTNPYTNLTNLRGSIEYSYGTILRHITEEEVQEWRDSPSSKGINSAGELKLPPTCAVVEADPVNDIFTVVRARCAPMLYYRKQTKSALIRNNRTGEEGYIERIWLEVVK
jgi:hypothetical protein